MATCIDISAASIVVVCPGCQWRVITADPVWARKSLLEHLDVAFHPRQDTKTARDSVKRWLDRNEEK